MTQLEIDPKLRTWGIALGVLVAALALVDVVVLKGEPVAGGTASLRADSSPLVIAVDRPYEGHTVEISTRRSSFGKDSFGKSKDKGRSIAWRLVGPGGDVVAEDSELVSHKKRFFDFFPVEAGEYALHLEETKLLGSGRGTATVRVTVGDRRVVSRLLGF